MGSRHVALFAREVGPVLHVSRFFYSWQRAFIADVALDNTYLSVLFVREKTKAKNESLFSQKNVSLRMESPFMFFHLVLLVLLLPKLEWKMEGGLYRLPYHYFKWKMVMVNSSSLRVLLLCVCVCVCGLYTHTHSQTSRGGCMC